MVIKLRQIQRFCYNAPMKKIIDGVLTSLVIISLIALSLIFNPISLSANQKDTLLILIIVCI